MKENEGQGGFCITPDISDSDVIEAMRELQGYVDITPGDFRQLYVRAYAHALGRLTRAVLARDVMSARVISAGPGDSLAEVAEAMASAGVSGVPVVQGAMVVGIVSEKDVMRLMCPEGGEMSFMRIVAECMRGEGCTASSVRRLRATDIMTAPAITVLPETPASEVAALLAERGINRVPVVDGDGQVMGIITRSDLVRDLGLRAIEAGGPEGL